MPKEVNTRSQKAWNRQERATSGILKRCCRAPTHDGNEYNCWLLALHGKKAKINKTEFKSLLEKGLIQQSDNFICSRCLELGKQNSRITSTQDNEMNAEDTDRSVEIRLNTNRNKSSNQDI